MRRQTRRARWEAQRAASSRRGCVCQRVQPVAALETYVLVSEYEITTLTFEGRDRSIDTSQGLHPFPTKELGLLSVSHTHISWRPPHLMRQPPTATLVAALPEQLPSAPSPADSQERWSVQGCTRGGGSVATNPAEAGGGVGRVFLGLDARDAGGRGWTRVAREGVLTS